nr:uncharacterized protein LOC119165410 [Rhipicephalus microplus]
MEFYSEHEDCKKLYGSEFTTSQFTRTLNKLFDCLNSRRPDHVRFNEAQHIAVLKDSIAWLDIWEKYIKTLPTQRQVCFLSKQTCGALRLTLHSSVALIESLLLSGFRYVLVGNFGQDPLERFFGIVRHVAGDGGQPTVQHFLFIYRMLSVNNLVRPPKQASVEGGGPQLLLKLQGLFDKGKPASSQIDMLAVLFDDVLEEPGEAVNNASVPDVTLSTKECILDYLAGYVVKKFSTISCTDCVGTLKSQTREPTDLIQKKSRGFLQVPSSQLLSLLRIVEGHVEELTVDTVACADVYANIVDQVLLDSRIASAGVGCRLHYVGTTAEVVHFFLRCRLHFYTREKNKLTRATWRANCPRHQEAHSPTLPCRFRILTVQAYLKFCSYSVRGDTARGPRRLHHNWVTTINSLGARNAGTEQQKWSFVMDHLQNVATLRHRFEALGHDLIMPGRNLGGRSRGAPPLFSGWPLKFTT